jgi:hypothetical protein
VLHVTRAADNFEFVYDSELMHELAAETFAMRLLRHTILSDSDAS